MDEGAGEGELLPHAAREPGCQPCPEGSESGELKELVTLARIVAQAVDFGEKGNVLVDREVAVEAEALRKVAQP